ncbi:MAG: hypothetical protein ACT4P5_23830, partial [Armatimonadota bacterium]
MRSQRGASGLIVALVAALVLVIAAAGVGGYYILRSRPTAGVTPPIPVSPQPPAPVPPVVPIQPVNPVVPAQPPAPPAASDPVTKIEIVATSPTNLPPNGDVKLKMTFVYNGSEKIKVEQMLAWRKSGGGMEYGRAFTDEIVPGPNTSEGWTWGSGDNAPGTKFQLFAAIKAGDKVFVSAQGVDVTVIPIAPQVPGANDRVSDLKLVAEGPTEVAPGAKVKLAVTFVFNGQGKTKLALQLASRG